MKRVYCVSCWTKRNFIFIFNVKSLQKAVKIMNWKVWKYAKITEKIVDNNNIRMKSECIAYTGKY